MPRRLSPASAGATAGGIPRPGGRRGVYAGQRRIPRPVRCECLRGWPRTAMHHGDLERSGVGANRVGRSGRRRRPGRNDQDNAVIRSSHGPPSEPRSFTATRPGHLRARRASTSRGRILTACQPPRVEGFRLPRAVRPARPGAGLCSPEVEARSTVQPASARSSARVDSSRSSCPLSCSVHMKRSRGR